MITPAASLDTFSTREQIHAALMKLFIGAADTTEEHPPPSAEEFRRLLDGIAPCMHEPDKRFVQLRLQPLTMEEWMAIFAVVPAQMRLLLIRAAVARIKEDRHRAEQHAILVGSAPAVLPSED